LVSGVAFICFTLVDYAAYLIPLSFIGLSVSFASFVIESRR
jgi:hypothetical protein